jgi:putative pyruvate formate lyase activating enzyme
MEFIARELSPDSYVNIMDQYHPQYRAGEFPELDRRITHQEYRQAVEIARKHGITRLDRC